MQTYESKWFGNVPARYVRTSRSLTAPWERDQRGSRINRPLEQATDQTLQRMSWALIIASRQRGVLTTRDIKRCGWSKENFKMLRKRYPEFRALLDLAREGRVVVLPYELRLRVVSYERALDRLKRYRIGML